jgi:hypothetical protein
MKSLTSVSLFVLLVAMVSVAQDSARPFPGSVSSSAASSQIVSSDVSHREAATDSTVNAPRCAAGSKFRYYLSETYLNPSSIAAPAFRAGIRMANPPGKGATKYPPEWTDGAEAYGRNYGDAVAERVSFQTARFVTGVITRERPGYMPSSSHNVLARTLDALAFTFVDRSDSGHAMPAISNFVGAAAAGFVGNAYLPAGFNDATHAGQRATVRFGLAAGGNLFREFAPQMPRPMRTFIQLIAR